MCILRADTDESGLVVGRKFVGLNTLEVRINISSTNSMHDEIKDRLVNGL